MPTLVDYYRSLIDQGVESIPAAILAAETHRSQQPIVDTDVLTGQEAAQFLKCSTDTLDNLERDGRIVVYRIGSGRGTKRYSRSNLLTYLESVRPTPLQACSAKRLKHLG